jgi:hypothetical protein
MDSFFEQESDKTILLESRVKELESKVKEQDSAMFSMLMKAAGIAQGSVGQFTGRYEDPPTDIEHPVVRKMSVDSEITELRKMLFSALIATIGVTRPNHIWYTGNDEWKDACEYFCEHKWLRRIADGMYEISPEVEE